MPGPEHQRLIVAGASAGGIEALIEVLRDLPADLPAAMVVVLHLSATSPSLLPQIIGRHTALTVRAAEDMAALEPGTIHVAVPDQHLLIEDGHLRLTSTARVNGHRPAVDPLFMSAAEAYGDRVAGVVLSGTRDDGTIGLARIRRHGGCCLVQEPGDARHDSMPRSAIDNVPVHAVLPAHELGSALSAWAQTGALPVQAGAPPPPDAPAAGGGSLTTVCPDCGGVLSERAEGVLAYWECRVGHRYAPRTLADRQGIAVEGALWAAVRALEDREALLGRLADEAGVRGHLASARRFRSQAESSAEQAAHVRGAIFALAHAAGEDDAMAGAEEHTG